MTENGTNDKSSLLEATLMAKMIREQHESSGSVMFQPGKAQKELVSSTDRLASIYEMDYAPKTVKPSEPRPCSVTRRNNPHPSHMFMNWKVPTRLIVDEPSYKQQKERLLLDSKQRFYEDINGNRKYASPSDDVLREVGKLREMDHKLLPSRRSLRTSTTHHVPPYGMFKHSREKDIEEELKAASSTGIKRVATPGAPKLPAMPFSQSQPGGTDIKSQMSRNLKPRAMPAAQDWLRTAGMSQTKVINNAMKAADIDRTLNRALQPDSKKAVEKWLSTANERDREVAIEFFGSLAGSKLMGAKEIISSHQLHTDGKGQGICKICDGRRLQDVMDALKKGKPVASVTLNKGCKQPSHNERRIQLLTPHTRSHKDEFQTWHHLPVFKHNGPVSNTIALFTRPHRQIPRHFTIHPEWD